MGQKLDKIETAYNVVAKEYAEAFLNEHKNKPMDQVMLKRFAKEIGDKKPVWDFGCGPGQTTRYLHNLGVETSGNQKRCPVKEGPWFPTLQWEAEHCVRTAQADHVHAQCIHQVRLDLTQHLIGFNHLDWFARGV